MKIKSLVLATSLLGCSALQAAPWIDGNDVFLRADIQTLSDAGLITSPVTTYPLMWSAIGQELEQANLNKLSKTIQTAYSRVLFYYRQATRSKGQTKVKLDVASDNQKFTSFGDDNINDNFITVSQEVMSDKFAAQLSVEVIADPLNGASDYNFDNSYAAMLVGNWIFRVDSLNKWWGPGWDSSLILSNNARPLPALSISRNNAKAFESKWLSWLGPWTLTAQMGKMESGRTIPNARLFSTRGSIRPIEQLEIGGSWFIQWGGDGQGNSLGDFIDAVKGETVCVNGEAVCDPSLETKIGNQMAGWDVRWSDSLFGQHYALYVQMIGEDGSNGSIPVIPADKGYIYGIEHHNYWGDNQLLFNFEYIETDVACGEDVNSFNCFYEHTDYQHGLRYKKRAMGTTFDNDANVYTFSVLMQQTNNRDWQFKLTYGDLNQDDKDRYPDDPDKGNGVTKVHEEYIAVELNTRQDFLGGKLSYGATVADTSVVRTDESDTDVIAFAKFEYRL